MLSTPTRLVLVNASANALLVSDLNWRESELKGVFDFNRLLRVIIAIGLAASSLLNFRTRQEITQTDNNFLQVSLEGEVASGEKLYRSIGIIAFERFRSGGDEVWIELAPYCQDRKSTRLNSSH